MRNSRKCIYTKDVQGITGKSESASRKLLQKIKNKLKKHRQILPKILVEECWPVSLR